MIILQEKILTDVDQTLMTQEMDLVEAVMKMKVDGLISLTIAIGEWRIVTLEEGMMTDVVDSVHHRMPQARGLLYLFKGNQDLGSLLVQWVILSVLEDLCQDQDLFAQRWTLDFVDPSQ